MGLILDLVRLLMLAQVQMPTTRLELVSGLEIQAPFKKRSSTHPASMWYPGPQPWLSSK
jgi:hypothetical protein